MHHTSALKCAVPRYIARCIDGVRTLRLVDPGNDLTVMGKFDPAAFGDCPTYGQKPTPGNRSAIMPTSLRGSQW